MQRNGEQKNGEVMRLRFLWKICNWLVVRFAITEEKVDALIALEKALKRLEKEDSREAKVVECRFFGGMTVEETAAALNISNRTVKRDWAMALAWLRREIVHLQ